jgi:hypothetical protein
MLGLPSWIGEADLWPSATSTKLKQMIWNRLYKKVSAKALAEVQILGK